MIDGVLVKPLKQIPDERGKIMHMLRTDDPNFDPQRAGLTGCVRSPIRQRFPGR